MLAAKPYRLIYCTYTRSHSPLSTRLSTAKPSTTGSLRRRNGQVPGHGGVKEDYSFQQLLDLRNRLGFFSSLKADELYWEKDPAPIANSTLFVIDRFDLDFEVVGFKGSIIKHLRINDSNTLVEDYALREDCKWDRRDLVQLLDTECPDLLTLVVPGHWPDSTLYQDFLELVKEKPVVILVEHGASCVSLGGNGETCISQSFKEHRRRQQETGLKSRTM